MRNLLLLLALFVINQASIAQEFELSPFFKIGTSDESISALSEEIKTQLQANDFKIVGEYAPESNNNLHVICFTRNDLQNLCLQSTDRGALASVLKVGLVKKGQQTTISMLNPEYMFCAYLSNYETDKNTYTKITADVKSALGNFGSEFTAFGGKIKAASLKKYHYKIMMPYFKDPVELCEFESFEAGVEKIRNNLNTGKENTKLIYEQVFKNEKIAVFGVGLLDQENGEKHFLPIIGEDHIAAMPYEIILQDKEVTMLHGKYRFALYWPELTMGTFMKIMSTPGDVEDFMEALTK
ncbi:hypothetical protein [Marinifilum fragile]|uniref:hypothetical protein n=1 Tax=Marinifilum fragile TaxID=570161 RepID=UPI002AA8C678|nr:hypothetical protein [Marinifilum fragile]